MDLKRSNCDQPFNTQGLTPKSSTLHSDKHSLPSRQESAQPFSQRDRTPPKPAGDVPCNNDPSQRNRPRRKIFEKPRHEDLSSLINNSVINTSFQTSPRKHSPHNKPNSTSQSNLFFKENEDQPNHSHTNTSQNQLSSYVTPNNNFSPEIIGRPSNNEKEPLASSPNFQQSFQNNFRGHGFESFAQELPISPINQFSHNPTIQIPPSNRSTVTQSFYKNEVQTSGNMSNPFGYQYNNFQIDATHPDLDSTYMSSFTSLHSARRRTKPIVVMNINIAPGRKEEVHVYEGDDPFEVASAFCIKYSLPNTLVQILGNNIINNVNNYYNLRAQKTRRSTSNNSTVENAPRGPHNQANYYQSNSHEEEFDPKFNERASFNQPLPHSYTPHPGLEESFSNEASNPHVPNLNLERKSIQAKIKQGFHHQNWKESRVSVGRDEGRLSQNDFGKDTSRSRDMRDLSNEGDRYVYYNGNNEDDDEEEEELEIISSDEARAIHKLDEEIQKLQKQKEKYLEKLKKSELIDSQEGNNLTPRDRASVVSQTKAQNYHQKDLTSRVLKAKGKLTVETDEPEERQHKLTRPLTTKNNQERSKLIEKSKESNKPKSKSPLRGEEENYYTGQDDIRKYEENTIVRSQSSRGIVSFGKPQKENNTIKSLNQKPAQTIQDKQARPKSPLMSKSPIVKPITPQRSTKHRDETPKAEARQIKDKKKFIKNETVENPLKPKSMNKLPQGERETNLRSSKHEPESPEADDLKIKVLNEIFNNLDEDFDGLISSDHVDISSLSPDIIDGISEILEALETGMVLSFQDFYNIVNHRKLLAALQKIYGNNRASIDSQSLNQEFTRPQVAYKPKDRIVCSSKESITSKDSSSTAHDSKDDEKSSVNSTLKGAPHFSMFEGPGEIGLTNKCI